MNYSEREALDAYLSRGDHDNDEPDDCLAGNDDPEALPCGRCAACERHAMALADTGESPAGGW
jgi:7-cyano-7-deazaguanine synthase in queuosine biosynthesis